MQFGIEVLEEFKMVLVPEVSSGPTRRNVWFRLTLPIAVLLLVAAGGGVFLKNLYRDMVYYTVIAIAQDLISLVVVAPTLVITGLLARRGSHRSAFVWLGVLIYLVYTYAIAAFDNQFNSLFLAYVALFGCSLYALIGGFLSLNKDAIKACFTKRTPVRAVSFYFALLGILFYFTWLREVIPALLAGAIPQSVKDNGTPTNAVHVLDMAWILPAFGIAAINLWRRRAVGYLLAGPLLSFVVLLASAVLSMIVSMHREGYALILPQVVMFIAVFAIGLGMLIWYLASFESPNIVQVFNTHGVRANSK